MGKAETKIAVMANNIENIKEDVKEIKTKLQNNYVTKAEFEPIKKVVYGMVGTMLVGVLGALLVVVLK